eukprot:2681898-Lingulodinium_polyedra.AAC.1
MSMARGRRTLTGHRAPADEWPLRSRGRTAVEWPLNGRRKPCESAWHTGHCVLIARPRRGFWV